jgi:uncharacterized protein YfaS (alpha-2-macroglobulin family)
MAKSRSADDRGDPDRGAVQWGNYRLDVAADGPDSTETSVSFSVGYESDKTADTPDVLDVIIDKASYANGETMQVRLSPRFAGKATLAVISDKVNEIRTIDIATGGATASIPVKAEWGASAYLVVLAHRPMDAAASACPAAPSACPGSQIGKESARSASISARPSSCARSPSSRCR